MNMNIKNNTSPIIIDITPKSSETSGIISAKVYHKEVHMDVDSSFINDLPISFSWLAISSVIAASASNQNTGRMTGLKLVKKVPIVGLGASCREIWSLIRI